MLKYEELNEYRESFSWLFGSYIQSHNNAAYLISCSMSLYDELMSDIAGKQGAFGDRLLALQTALFTK